METFIAGAVFGLFGTAYFVYGKKTEHPVALFTGVALCVFPYMVDNLWLTIGIGIVLLAVPFVVKS
jgi:hypothetical protein